MCFSSTPVPPTAARIFVLSNLDSVGRDSSDSVSPCQASIFVGCQVGDVGYPAGTRWVSHWDTVGCPTGTRCVPHWDTVCAPLGHGACPTGTRYVPHWGTVRVPLGYGACPTGVRWVSHWGTGDVPPRHTERDCAVTDSPCRLPDVPRALRSMRS